MWNWILYTNLWKKIFPKLSFFSKKMRSFEKMISRFYVVENQSHVIHYF